MIFDYSKTSKSENYKLMSSSIIPRPIAWIVTTNDKGVVNVAPISYFTALSSNPATLIVSIGHKKNADPKDTLKNIRENKKCTVCIAQEEFLDKLHLSSKELKDSESEAEIFDIPLKRVFEEFPPMIEDVAVAFFCKFYKEIELKDSKTIPLIVEIKKQFVNDKFIDKDGKIDFNPIARVGRSYKRLGSEMEPPKI